MTIPNVAHFVFGLQEQSEPFHLAHYVALESCRRLVAPDAIHFHYKHLPYGVYWDLIRPHLTLHQVELVPEVLQRPSLDPLVRHYSYAHHADFIRLDALIAIGGIYADIDTVFVTPIPQRFFDCPFVIGREDPVLDERTGILRPSLCNALMMSEPASEYATTWRKEMGSALDGTWNRHSCLLAEELSGRLPHALHIEPPRTFHPFGANHDGIAMLFEGTDHDWDGIVSVHLWSHLWWERERRDFTRFHASLLTREYVATVDTTYNLLARPFLPALELW